jgi:hypothetical protein
MIRSALLLSLSLACFAVDDWQRIDPTMGSVGFSMASSTSSDVNFGPISKRWTEATRSEVYFRSYYPSSGGMQPFFEGALFNDSQNYHDSDGKIDVDTFGLSVAFGATVLPFGQSTRNPMTFGLMPYVRFAGGSSDVYIRDLQFEGETYKASGSVGRLDFGGGADVRVTLGRHIEAAVGGGINLWTAANIYAYSTPNGGGVAISQSVDFSGYDAFLRASVGFSF